MKNREMKSVFLRVMTVALLGAVFIGNSIAGSSDKRFVDNKNGTVLDTKTNLTWHKTDYAFQTVAEAVKKKDLTLEDLEQFVRNLRTAGYKDWRVPTDNEFDTISYTKSNPEWISDFTYSVGSYLSLKKQQNGTTYTLTWTYSNESKEIGFRPVRGASEE